MSTWFIDVAVAMNSEIELPVVHNDAFIKAGKQDVLLSSESVDGNCQQSVIAPRVAIHN